MNTMVQTTSAFGRSSNHRGVHTFDVQSGVSSGGQAKIVKFSQHGVAQTQSDQELVKASSTDFSIVVRSFEAECGLVEFIRPLQVNGVGSGDGYELELPVLGILEFGASYLECFRNFVDALAFRWEEYALERDENLSPRAQEIARTFRAMVKG